MCPSVVGLHHHIKEILKALGGEESITISAQAKKRGAIVSIKTKITKK